MENVATLRTSGVMSLGSIYIIKLTRVMIVSTEVTPIPTRAFTTVGWIQNDSHATKTTVDAGSRAVSQ